MELLTGLVYYVARADPGPGAWSRQLRRTRAATDGLDGGSKCAQEGNMLAISKALLALGGGLLIAGMGSVVPQQATTVTGCLSKGAAKDTFDLKGNDGKQYRVTSTTVKLGQHVGHTVKVEGGTPAADKPLTVTKLTMVSAKCG